MTIAAPKIDKRAMPFVEALAAHHDRKGFDCGSESLNNFLQKQARQNADRNLGVTRVVIAGRGDSAILGYYTLVTGSIEREIIPNKKLPPGKIGVILLGRLATDKRAQGKGLGRQILLRAMEETVVISRSIGVYALTLDAIDERARSWYLSLDFGFRAFMDGPNHLYVPVTDIDHLNTTPLTDEL